MPARCSAANCKGNYRSGPKVSVFSFPMDEDQAKIWLRAIHREDLVPNTNSRVCELHFQECDIEREVSIYDKHKEIIITAPLKRPRLRAGAVPSKMVHHGPRRKVRNKDGPDRKRKIIEFDMLESPVLESLESDVSCNSKVFFCNLEELKQLPLNIHTDWTVLKKPDALIIALINDSPNPIVDCSVRVDDKLSLSVCHKNVRVKILNGQVLPTMVCSVNDLEHVVNMCYDSFSSGSVSLTRSDDVVSLLFSCIDSLKNIIPEKSETLQVLKKQASLLDNRAKYSEDVVVF